MNVHDIADYMLKEHGSMTAMKLHKLLYYCQAWSLVWDARPIFPEPIQAWINGPVIPAIYPKHTDQFLIAYWPWGKAFRVTSEAKDTITAVVHHYGDRDSQYLSDLTHQEDPWIFARKGLPPKERGESVISLASMEEYYSSIAADD